jgi:dihydrofolate synthase/folylpolyglutamate synthase
MLQSLSQVAITMHLTHFDYKRVLDLPSLLEQTPHKDKHAHEDPFKAVDMLIDRYHADVIIITGSLYFVSLMRPYLIEKPSI